MGAPISRFFATQAESSMPGIRAQPHSNAASDGSIPARQSAPTVRVTLASDLHLECRPLQLDEVIAPSVSADVLCLLGDIGDPFLPGYFSFLQQASARFPVVLLLAGNHEYYSPQDPTRTMQDVDNQITELCSQLGNVHYLSRRSWQQGAVRFVGATLWSRIPTDLVTHLGGTIHDFHSIFRAPGEAISPVDTNTIFTASLQYIQDQVAEAQQAGQHVVVLTHHCPTLHGTFPDQYKGQPSCYAFATDLEKDMGGVDVWLSGHTHFNFDMNINGTRVASNQFGYGITPGARYKTDWLLEV